MLKFLSKSNKPPIKRPPIKAQLCELMKWVGIITLTVFAFVVIMFMINVKRAKAEAIHGDKPVRGWLWYEDPEEEKKEQPQKEQPRAQEPEKTTKKEEPAKKEFEFPVQESAPPALKKFLLDPTEENAKEYLVYQYKYLEHLKKIGYALRDVYLRFGGDIYPIQGYPESPLSSTFYYGMKDSIFQSVINKVKDKVGLVYFYSTTCPDCIREKDTIIALLSKYGLSMRGVSVNGALDSGLPFPSVYNPDLIAQYGVTQIPSLIAVVEKPEGPKVGGLSAGMASLDEIERMLVRFLVVEGVVKERDLNPVFMNK